MINTLLRVWDRKRHLYIGNFSIAPSSAPQQIRVSQTEEPGQLRVWWLAPDTLSHNGHITGYHIKAVPQNVESSKIVVPIVLVICFF